ncbi:4-Cys prefix domain-containing protein [Fontibacillus sp. BL9]|uniref:4-Cys prefix domain-containing protein n=1 Tax=Fontibacillus sp. BL9 TaxID=3389971 RepID=UPI00397B143B
MICRNCHHQQNNENAKFCENCGTPLNKSEGPGPIPKKEEHRSDRQQASEYLESAKKASKLYFKFFASALRSPVTYAKSVGKEQFVNGIITMILYSLVIPLIVYSGFHRLAGFMDHPFLNLVVRPTVAFAVLAVLTAAYCYLAVWYGKGKAGFQDVVARFGVHLVPFTALLILALLMAVLQINLFQSLLLMVGLFGSIFSVPAFVIISYIPEKGAALDQLQSTILVYIAAFITVGLLGKILFGPIGRLLGEGMSLFY